MKYSFKYSVLSTIIYLGIFILLYSVWRSLGVILGEVAIISRSDLIITLLFAFSLQEQFVGWICKDNSKKGDTNE